MTMYIIIALMPVIIATFYGNINRNIAIKKRYCITTGILLFLFLALRARTIGSTDTINYYNTMARAINSSSWNEFYNPYGVESGAQLFFWLLSRVFHDPQWIIVVSSAIYVISILYCFWNNSKNIPLALTMYICLGLMSFEMQGMRQAIAMSICLFAFEFAKRRKLLHFLALVLLAMQFHQTAVVFLCVYFLPGIEFNVKNIILMMGSCVIILFFSSRIVMFANALFGRAYFSTVDGGGFVATAVYFIIIFLVLLLTRKPFQEYGDPGMFYILMLGSVCFMMRYFGTLAAERISFYFMFSQCIMLPNVIVDGRLNAQSKSLMLFSVEMLTILLFAYRLIGSNLLPYLAFWRI